MKNITKKSVVLCVLSVLISVIMLTQLGISFMELPKAYYNIMQKVSGYSFLSFSVMGRAGGYRSDLTLLWIFSGLFTWSMLLSALAFLGLAVGSLFFKSRKAAKIINLIGVIVRTLLSFLYCLLTVLLVFVFVDFSMYPESYMVSTWMQIGVIGIMFLLTAGLFIAFLVCYFRVKDTPLTANAAPMSATDASESDAPAVIEGTKNAESLPAESADEGQEGQKGQDGQTVHRLPPDKVDFMMMNFKGLVPETGMPVLRNALLRADERKASQIMFVPLKNPTSILLFSIFLGDFGVDRFCVGDVGLGVAKLLVGWMTGGIWPFIDIFFCYKKAREKNLETLLAALR